MNKNLSDWHILGSEWNPVAGLFLHLNEQFETKAGAWRKLLLFGCTWFQAVEFQLKFTSLGIEYGKIESTFPLQVL